MEDNSTKKASKSTPYIIFNIFLERYCTSGILAILPLFLHQKMHLDKNTATSLFHLYEGFTLLFTIVGAILADVWLGIFKSIVIMTNVYILGILIIAISMIDPLNLPVETLVLIGFTLTVIGCGCIKGNTNVFGGNQHKLPEEDQELETFFSSQYFGLKCGSLLARFTMPILREDVKCFEQNDCYSLTFSVPMITLMLALIVLLLGYKSYIHVPSNGNVLLKIIKCVTHALSEKRKNNLSSSPVKQHWLNFATEKYGKTFVLETKIAFKVLVIFVTFPMFWTLHMQQGSRWIFQATRMNGDIGFYRIKPDQMIAFNSILVALLIPVFNNFLYPLMKKLGSTSMLHRMMLGCTCSLTAFVVSAFLETQVEKYYLSILWQLPQIFIISMAEIFAYLSHLNFAYTEAPTSIKPAMVACMYLSIAAGDVMVAIISGTALFESQAVEYLFFAFLMLLNLILLIVLARRYKHTDHEMLRNLKENENILSMVNSESATTRL